MPKPPAQDSPAPSSPAPQRPAPTSGLRLVVERASVPVLVRLSRLPKAVPFLVLLLALVLALIVGGPIAVALTGFVVFVVAWLLYLGWPQLSTSERLGRVAVLLVAIALCVTQAFPR